MIAWMLASVTALVALSVIVGWRRRAARRAAEAEARARARRRQLPLVSSNLRGGNAGSGDLWQDARAGMRASDPAGRQG
jgi:hypothetical protein